MSNKVDCCKPKRELPHFSLQEGDVKGLKDLTIDEEVEFKISTKVTSINKESYNDNKISAGFKITSIEIVKYSDGKKIKEIKSAKNLEDLEKAEKTIEGD